MPINYDDFRKHMQANSTEEELSPWEQVHQEDLAQRTRSNLENMGFASRALARGVNQLESMGYGAAGLAGSLTGIKPLQDWGMEGYKRNTEEASTYPGTTLEDIGQAEGVLGKVGKAAKWTAEKVIEQVPNLAMSAVTAGTGGIALGSGKVLGSKVIEKAASGLIKKNVANMVAKGATKEAATKAALQNLGAKAGVLGSTALIESGGMYGEGMDRGIDNPVSSLAFGTAAGFVELLGGHMRIVDKIFDTKAAGAFKKTLAKTRKAVNAGEMPDPKDIGLLGRMWREGVTQGLEEGGQESVQEALAIANIAVNDPTFEALSNENLKRIAESGLAGLAVGGLTGGVTGSVSRGNVADTGQDQRATKLSDEEVSLKKPATVADQAREILGVQKGQTAKDVLLGNIPSPEELRQREIDDAYREQVGAQRKQDVLEAFPPQALTEKELKVLKRQDARGAFKDMPQEPEPKTRIPEDLKEAFAIMSEEVNSGQVERNESHIIGSSYPDWFRTLSKEKNISKADFNTVMDKVRADGKLTDRQLDIYLDLKNAAAELKKTNKDLVAQQEIEDIEKKGFDIVGKKVPVGDIKEGDELIIKGEEYKHTGYDKDGNAILEDGVTIKADPFEMVEVDGIKKGSEKTKTKPEQMPEELTEEEDSKNIKKILAQEEQANQKLAQPKEKQVYDYSSTQVDLPEKETKPFKEFNKKIPDSELYINPEGGYETGREDKPHVTVRYGLDTANPEDIKPILEGQSPIKAKLGKVSIFEQDDHDVVKVDIESPELHALNKKIGENIDVPGETFPDYKPHATIAYVKKGEGKKYVGNTDFEGKEITFNGLTFSGKDGKETTIPLTGSVQPKAEPLQETGKIETEVAQPAQTEPKQPEVEPATEPITSVTEKVTEEKPEAKTEFKPGRSWTKANQQRTIIDAKEITRGKRKGKYKITLPDGKTEIVEKSSITIWPEKVETKAVEPETAKVEPKQLKPEPQTRKDYYKGSDLAKKTMDRRGKSITGDETLYKYKPFKYGGAEFLAVRKSIPGMRGFEYEVQTPTGDIVHDFKRKTNSKYNLSLSNLSAKSLAEFHSKVSTLAEDPDVEFLDRYYYDNLQTQSKLKIKPQPEQKPIATEAPQEASTAKEPLKKITTGSKVKFPSKGGKTLTGTITEEKKASFVVKGDDGSLYMPSKSKVELVGSMAGGQVRPETKVKPERKEPEVKAVVEPKAEKPKTTIEDFGEKIGGARKDYASILDASKSEDIASQPLSKSFPEPNYKKLLDAGTDPYIVAFIRSAREEIPTKPKKSWKLKQYTSQVEMLRGFASDLLSGKITKEQLQKKLSTPEFETINRDIGGRAELYETVGHDKSLSGLKLSKNHYSLYHGEKNITKWEVTRHTSKTFLSNMPRTIAAADTKEEVIKIFKEKYNELLAEKPKDKPIKFDLYRYNGEIWIGKKTGPNYIDLKKFNSTPEAREYLKNNHDELVKLLEKAKYIPESRREKNRERTGTDYRGGKDVTPEMFTESFGFRGVEFGNWVSKNNERQNLLNDAYDALQDLAHALNIPTKAISLNGELGLGFGSRGAGGKGAPSAHYEPNRVVINLTRMKGAGALAHEWWHALDNYFARQGGRPSKHFSDYGRGLLSKAGFTDLRQELAASFENIFKEIYQTDIKKRSKLLDAKRHKPYWTEETEISARVFENYIVSKLEEHGISNDYLVNFKSFSEYAKDAAEAIAENDLDFQDMYPYLTDSEIKNIVTAFDDFFKTLKTKETEKGVAFYSLSEKPTTKGIQKQTAQNIAAATTKNWRNAPDIQVVQSSTEIPSNVIGKSDIDLKNKSIKGVFTTVGGKRNVYIVADNIANAKELKTTLAEETLGHDGLRQAFGKSFNGVLDAVWNGHSEQIKPIANDYGIDLSSKDGRRNATDEWISKEISNDTLPQRVWSKIVQIARQWLRNILPNLELSVNEIKAMARAAIKRGDTNQAGVNEFAVAPSFSIKNAMKKITDNPAFRKWFGGSKVVDENGEPLVVYHGTDKDFNAFDFSKLGIETDSASSKIGFFFSSKDIADQFSGKTFFSYREGSKIIPSYLSIKNPKIISAADFQEMLFGERARSERVEELKDDIEIDYGDSIEIDSENAITTIDNESGQPIDIDIDELSEDGAESYGELAKILSEDPRDLSDGRRWGFTDIQWFDFKKDLIEDGYDGIIVDAEDFSGGEYNIEQAEELYENNYIVFDPTQIKSIFNQGTFDPNNADIRFQFEDSLTLPFEEGTPTKEKVEAMKKWLNDNTDKYNPKFVTLYHSTGKSVPIIDQGIKPTSLSRRRSYQSTSGYVYLAPTIERAKMFGDLGNMSNSKVYAVKVRVQDLKADIDQLNNQRTVGVKVGNSVAESLVYGGSARVKGKIDPWQIKEIPDVEEHTRFSLGGIDQHERDIKQKTISTAKDKAKASKAFDKASDQADNDLDEGKKESYKPLIKHVMKKKDTTVFDRVVSTPLHYFKKLPATWRMFKSGERKNDNAQIMIEHVTNSGDINNPLTKVMYDAQKLDPKGYKVYEKELIDADKYQRGYRIIQDQASKQYMLFGPKEKKLPGEFDKLAEAQKHVRKQKIQEGMARYVLNHKTGKINIYLPAENPIKTFATDADASEEAIQRAIRDFKTKFNPSEAILNAYKAKQRITYRAFDVYSKGYRQLIKYYEDNNLPLPYIEETVNGEKVKVDLRMQLAAIGDRRGYFFPRNRNSGKYTLVAHGKGKPSFRQNYDLMLENIPTEDGKIKKWKEAFNATTPIGREARRLQKEGYTDISVDVSKQLPEDIFELAGGVVRMQEEINQAFERMQKGDYGLEDFGLTTRRDKDKNTFVISGATPKEMTPAFKKLGGKYYGEEKGKPREWHFDNPGKNFEKRLTRALLNVSNVVERETMNFFAKNLMENLANLEKARGFRAHMIARNMERGEGVWVGYEEDPAKAYQTYVAGLAGGESKKQMASELGKYMTGTDISWPEFNAVRQFEGTYDEYLGQRKVDPDEVLSMPPLSREDFEQINDPEAYKAELEKTDEDGGLESTGFGRYMKFVKNRKVDAVEQKNAFHDAKVFMQDMLRNEESIDRMVGTLKGLAVSKYLAYRVVAAPLVNATVMGTAVPGAMNAYGDISLSRSVTLVGKAISDYIKYKIPSSKERMSREDIALFEEIERRGWHKAQMNKEALSALEGKMTKGWRKFLEIGMYAFGVVEQMNRAATIAATYKGLKEKNKSLSQSELLEKSKEISDKANSVYHKVNLPSWARGTGLGGNILRSAYVFKSFSHNYLQLMKDAWGDSWTPEHKRAFAWLALSPAVLAGTGATVGKEALFALSGALGFGEDDPEEEFYNWANDTFGKSGERFARYGAFGMLGINLKGSLEIGVTDLPTSIGDLLGAPWSVVSDVGEGIAQLSKGNVAKGFEKILPLAAGNVIKSVRESTQGVTTKNNTPIFYGKDPLVADNVDAFYRALSFNPARLSGIREKQWNEKKVISKYNEYKRDINSKFKKFFRQPKEKRTQADYIDLMAEVKEYNSRVIRNGLLQKGVSLITSNSIKGSFRRTVQAPKIERMRVVNE